MFFFWGGACVRNAWNPSYHLGSSILFAVNDQCFWGWGAEYAQDGHPKHSDTVKQANEQQVSQQGSQLKNNDLDATNEIKSIQSKYHSKYPYLRSISYPTHPPNYPSKFLNSYHQSRWSLQPVGRLDRLVPWPWPAQVLGKIVTLCLDVKVMMFFCQCLLGTQIQIKVRWLVG